LRLSSFSNSARINFDFAKAAEGLEIGQ